MGSLWFAAGIATLVPVLLLHAHALYSTLLLVLGSVMRRRKPPSPSVLPRIAALVVAHDEEAVIVRSVKSLVSQDYPAERFSVIVIADNCSDATAERARACGAEVIERRTGAPEGKAAALAFGVTEMLRRGGYDAAAFFDADNVIDAHFLARVGSRLKEEETVVQGLVDSYNPASSWVAASSALGFWAIAAVQQAPRERLRLSAPLMGTAFAARLDTCERTLHGLSTLTDDLELAARLALRGERVAYEPLARVLDEKPVEVSVALGQRHRWMQGRWAVAARYWPKLVARALLPGGELSVAARLRALDVAAQLISPSLLFSATALGVLACLEWLVLQIAPPAYASGATAVTPTLSLCLAAVYFIVPGLSMARLVRPARAWFYYAVQPFYLLFSVPLALTGFAARSRRGWRRTLHGSEGAR